jgi:hypothetical protein
MVQVCTEDLRLLETRIPSLVFAVSDSGGADVVDARVTENGAVVVDALDGRATELDPGPHRLHFEAPGKGAVEISLVVREGEKLRPVRVTLPVASPAPANPGPLRPPPSSHLTGAPSSAPSTRSTPVPALVAGGVALAATIGFSYFGIRGLAERSDLDACRGACDHAEVMRAKTDLLVADVLLATAVLGYVAFGVLFLSRPSAPAPTARRVP